MVMALIDFVSNGILLFSLHLNMLSCKHHLLRHHEQKRASKAQLGERQTLDHKGQGLILTVVSLSKTLHPHCLILVKPRKPSQND